VISTSGSRNASKRRNTEHYSLSRLVQGGILSGSEISELIRRVNSDSPVDPAHQSQPAGYDVTVSKAFEYPKESHKLSVEKTENSALAEIFPNQEGYFVFQTGAYLIELNEITTIPKDVIGILLPRSTLLRNGLDIRSALFDPGYSGQPKVMLVCHRPASIQRYARVGQLVLFRSGGEFSSQYSGRYQGERSV
jgi:deoxycytidine triphosphate deaminase